MSEKSPRIRPHERAATVLGAEQAKRALNSDQHRRLGQMSITDGVPIPREAPPEIPTEVESVLEHRTMPPLDGPR